MLKEWSDLIFAAILIATAIDLFLRGFDDEKKNGISKCIKCVVGLVISCIIILPMIKLLNNFEISLPIINENFLYESEKTEQKYIISLCEKKLKEFIEQKILEITGIKLQSVCIELIVNENNEKFEVVPKKASVVMNKEDSFKSEMVSNIIFETLNISPTVVTE